MVAVAICISHAYIYELGAEMTVFEIAEKERSEE